MTASFAELAPNQKGIEVFARDERLGSIRSASCGVNWCFMGRFDETAKTTGLFRGDSNVHWNCRVPGDC